MTLATALARLETWTVGTATVIPFDEEVRSYGSEELPLLIIRFPTTYVDAYRLVNVNADDGIAKILIEHVLLLSSFGLGADRFSDVVSFIDLYLAEVNTDSTLNDTLIQPLYILQINPGIHEVAGILYWGIIFTLVLPVEVA